MVMKRRRPERRRAIMRLPFSIISLFLLLGLDILRADDVEIVTEEPSVAPSFIYNNAQSPNAPPFVDRPGQAEPTLQPVPQLFTADPTPRPTPAPTRSPTRAPTRAPTLRPTRRPTRRPTASPTTPRPTRRPTRMPSSQPSDSPSMSPTRAPTLFPTTPRPTPVPTRRLTRIPTATPSSAPSGEPSIPPTNYPTSFTPKPTITMMPTETPTPAPTAAPSSSPSSTPSYSLQSGVSNVLMRLESAYEEYTGRAAIIFKAQTALFIRNSIEETIGEEMDYLYVDLSIVSSRLVLPQTQTVKGQRELQELLPLEMILDVLVDYRSATIYNVSELVGNAFNSDEERSAYIERLQRTGGADFADLVNVQVFVDGEKPPEEPEGTSGGAKIGVIVGSVVGGLVVIVLGLFTYRKVTTDPDKEIPETSAGSSEPKMAIQTEIVVDRQDDISTLGDPAFGGMMMSVQDGDERTANVAEDYDYARQFLQSGPSEDERDRLNSMDSDPLMRVSSSRSGYSKPGLGPMSASVFSDDASFEQQYTGEDSMEEERFEITVPPGKLGMVIDTPNGGVPVVHALKSESVLAGKIEVGDRLVSVDGQNVTSMSALQVSKLISLRADQKRKLAFVRLVQAGGP